MRVPALVPTLPLDASCLLQQAPENISCKSHTLSKRLHTSRTILDPYLSCGLVRMEHPASQGHRLIMSDIRYTPTSPQAVPHLLRLVLKCVQLAHVRADCE
jgi:hypothetical protein